MLKKALKKSKRKYDINYVRLFFIGFTIYFLTIFLTQQLQINEYNVKINSINSEIEEYKTNTEKLKKIQENINDADYIENISREELGLVKPYEKIFIDINK